LDTPLSILDSRNKREFKRQVFRKNVEEPYFPDTVKVTPEFLEKAKEMCRCNRGNEWFAYIFANDDGVIEDFVIPFQSASGAHVQVSSEAVVEFMERTLIAPTLKDVYGRTWKGWIHSHGSLGVFFSSTDMANIEVLSRELVWPSMEIVKKEHRVLDRFEGYEVVGSTGFKGDPPELCKVLKTWGGYMVSIVVNDQNQTYQQIRTITSFKDQTTEKDFSVPLEFSGGNLPEPHNLKRLTHSLIESSLVRNYKIQTERVGDYWIIDEGVPRESEEVLKRVDVGAVSIYQTPFGSIRIKPYSKGFKFTFDFGHKKKDVKIKGKVAGAGFNSNGLLVGMTDEELVQTCYCGWKEKTPFTGLPPQKVVLDGLRGTGKWRYLNHTSMGSIEECDGILSLVPRSMGKYRVISDV